MVELQLSFQSPFTYKLHFPQIVLLLLKCVYVDFAVSIIVKQICIIN